LRALTFSAVPRKSCHVFKFCAPGLVFRRYRGRRVPFSRFARPNSCSSVPGPRVKFSCFARQDSFSSVPRASLAVLMFSAPGHFFKGTEGVGSRFHVLRSRTRFQRYRGRRVPLSCFALPDSFSVVPRASGPVFTLCDPELVFGGTGGVGSRFLILRARKHFRRCRGRRVPFSCFACPDSFLTVPRASCPVFLFCAPGLIFDGTEGVGSVFILCAPGLVFGGTGGVGYRFRR
jgi:hypothetical protein